MLKKQSFNISILILLLVFIITRCEANQNAQAAATEHLQQLPMPFTEGQSLIDLENLDDLLKLSDNIIIGDIIDEADFNGTTSKYTVQVKEAFKGPLEVGASIDVYHSTKGLSKNRSLILFLEYFESEYYPRPIYSTIGENLVLAMDGDKVFGNNHIYKAFNKTDDLLNYIKKSAQNSAIKTNTYMVKDKAKDAKELIEVSEFIVKLVPEEIVLEGKQASSYKVRTIKVYQGEFNSPTLNLPSNVVIGKEYIVFLKQRVGALTLSTRQDSLLASDSKQWEEIQLELGN